MDSDAFPLKPSSGRDRRRRPGRSDDRAGAVLLRHSLRRVRGQCRPVDRDQGRHHADAHAGDLAALRRGEQRSDQGHAGRRDRRHRARDQPQPRLRQASPAARRDAVSVRHQSAAARDGAGAARLPGRLGARCSPLPASADVVHAASGQGDARTRHAGRQEDIRRLLSARLRRRTQHGARPARRHRRGPLAAGALFAWSISRSISTSRTRAIIRIWPISATPRNG